MVCERELDLLQVSAQLLQHAAQTARKEKLLFALRKNTRDNVTGEFILCSSILLDQISAGVVSPEYK